MAKDFHVFIGTKGEVIKMAPVMRELQARNIEYNFINSGQHNVTTKHLIEDFQLKQPDIILDNRSNDVANLRQGLAAIIKNVSKSPFKKKNIFKGKKGITLLIGDTNTTIQGLIISKLAGIETCHIEAGERTYRMFEPFPEEIVRRIVNRYSEYLFPLSEQGHKNLLNEKAKGKIYPIKYNTVLDSVRLALKSKPRMEIPKGKYVVATCHRLETIFSKERFTKVIDILERISKDEHVIYVTQPSAKVRLREYGLLSRVENNPNITMKPLYDYISFMNLINKSKYIVTDGGGPQEESAFMNKPCLLLRNTSERLWYTNVFISELKDEKVEYFLNNIDQFKRKELEDKDYSPAREIVDILEKLE